MSQDKIYTIKIYQGAGETVETERMTEDQVKSWLTRNPKETVLIWDWNSQKDRTRFFKSN